MNWIEAITHCHKTNRAFVIITIINTRRSTPRNCGAKMLVTHERSYDTIGGGELEYKVIAEAQRMLIANCEKQQIREFSLSAHANQCCGGAVTVFFESHFNARPEIHIFGAGHVAKALVTILSQTHSHLHWIDSRKDEFPNNIDSTVNIHVEGDVTSYIENMRPGSMTLIMTHSHNLDFKILESLLDRHDCSYIGLIGSKTKALRFRKRLKSNSFTEEDIKSFFCPVGLLEIKGKYPMEVAVSIAAQILQKINIEPTRDIINEGISHHQIRAIYDSTIEKTLLDEQQYDHEAIRI